MAILIEPLRDAPAAMVDSSADSLLTPAVSEVLQGILALLARQAQKQRLMAGPILVRGVPASDEAPARLLVSQQTTLPFQEAMQYWDTLGNEIERWAAGLPVPQAEIALDAIVLDMQWISSDNAL